MNEEIEKFNSNIPDEIELNLDEDIDEKDVMQTKMLGNYTLFTLI